VLDIHVLQGYKKWFTYVYRVSYSCILYQLFKNANNLMWLP